MILLERWYFLSKNDLFITPFFVLLVLALGYVLKRRISDPEESRYFYWGIILKTFSAIAFALIFEFFYHGGDTSAYWRYGTIVGSSLYESGPSTWIKLLFAGKEHNIDFINYSSQIRWFGHPATYFVVRISGLIAPFCFNTYMVIAIVFSLLSFSGNWVVYKLFIQYFPKIKKELAIGMLFAPSILLWSAGILKDTITYGGLMWLLYALHNIFINKRKIILSIIIAIICIYVIKVVKIYILLAFAPAFIVWVFFLNFNKIKNRAIRVISLPFLAILFMIAGFVMLQLISADTERYKLENLAETAERSNTYITSRSIKRGGNFYDIGTMDGSVASFLTVPPKAIGVSLFGPYLWEIRNPFMLITGVESFAFLALTILIVSSKKRSLIIYGLKKHPILIYCLSFSLVLAFATGLATANYGSLVRYKIPLIPFYWAFLVVIWAYQKGKLKVV